MRKMQIVSFLLLLSLFGNAFAVSYYWGEGSAKREWLIERAALPPEIEELLPQEISARREELRPLIRQLRVTRQEMMHSLVTKPYDAAKVDALAADVRRQTIALQEAFQGILVDIAIKRAGTP